MDAESLTAKGDGGMRQMHNYVDLNMSNQMGMQCPSDDFDYKKSNKISEELTVEKLQQQRDQELQKITGGRPPMGI
jgi:hypothetical protein